MRASDRLLEENLSRHKAVIARNIYMITQIMTRYNEWIKNSTKLRLKRVSWAS
jgi:hypothetical protein